MTSISTGLRRRALIGALLAGGLTGTIMMSVPAAAEVQPAPASATAPTVGLGLDPLGDLAASALLRLDTVGASDLDFIEARNLLAAGVAIRTGLDPVQMQSAWTAADPEHQRALLAGLSQLGVPYHRNTSNPGVSFDCSGLTTYAWSAAGFNLIRQSGGQIKAAAPRSPETAQAGDLVYYPGHVSMWLGVDRGILHAPYPGRDVEVKIQTGHKTLRFGDPTG